MQILMNMGAFCGPAEHMTMDDMFAVHCCCKMCILEGVSVHLILKYDVVSLLIYGIICVAK